MSDPQDPNAPGGGDKPADTPKDDLRDHVRDAERSGLEALEAGDFESASRLLLEAVGGYEELGDQRGTNSAAYYLGVALAEQGKISQALAVWEEVVDRGLDSPSAFTRLIRHYEEQNDATQVRRLFDRLGQAAHERTGEFFAAVDRTHRERRFRDLAAGASASGGAPLALIADDEVGIRSVVERSLQSVGYEVAKVEDGTAALEAILARPFDLIILDVFMPGPTGLDVLYRIRAEGIRTQVIVISGRGDEQMVRDAQRLGARWLGKPFDIEVLEDMARKFLDESKK